MVARTSVRHGRWLVGLIAVAALAGCSASAANGPRTDAGARSELAAAIRHMEQASGFRFSATAVVRSHTTHVDGDFHDPSTIHESATATGGPATEIVFDGRATYVKDAATGTWRVQHASNQQLTDPRRAFSALLHATAIRRGEGAVLFTVPRQHAAVLGGPAGGAVQVRAVITADFLAELAYRLGDGSTVTIDYRDVGRTPPITVPTGV